MTDKDFKVGDLVWAKMKTYPYWPAKIVHPPPKIKVPSLKKVQHCVCFFGTGDHAWITNDFLAHHSDDMVLKSKKGTKKISVALQNAIDEIIEVSKNTYDNVTSPINGELDNEEEEVEEMSPNPSPQIIKKKVGKRKESEMEDDDEQEEVEKDDDEQEEVEKDDDEQEEVEIDDDEQEEVGKNDDEQEEIEKDDDEHEEVSKDDNEQEDVEIDDDEQEDVERDDDEQEEVETDNIELEEAEEDNLKQVDEIEKDEGEREENSSDELDNSNLSESSSEEDIAFAVNGESEEINSETSQNSVFSEKSASKVKKKVGLSQKRKKGKPNKSRKRRCSTPVRGVMMEDLPSPSTCSRASSICRDRVVYIERPPTPVLDVMKASAFLKAKDISPTDKKIGFLGLGMIGRGVVKNLLNSGHRVTVWNRNPAKCEPFVKAGALKGLTPADVVASCDVTFCCVSDPMAVKTLVFESCGVLKGFEGCTAGTKGYVEMSSIDPVTTAEISNCITKLGGRYLEAPVIGSRELAEEGALLSLVSGDRELFNDCYTCFFAFTRNVYYLSNNVGFGCKMNLIQSMLYGTTAAALAEALSLVERCDLSQDKFLEILAMGPMNCPLVRDKGSAMIDKDFTVSTALKHQIKNLNLVLQMSDACRQSTTTSSMANQLFKRAQVLKYTEHDVSAVIMGAQ